MTTPDVSIIVPLYQSAGTIAQTLASLLAQDGPTLEVVVVDDGSTDDGPERVRGVAAIDPRVRLVRRPNGGLPAARNTGIDEARGAHLLFCDADDGLHPGGLARLLDAARGAGAACGGASFVDEASEPLGWDNTPPPGGVGLADLLTRNPMMVPSQIFSRRALRGLRYDETLRAAEDWDLARRLAFAGQRWEAVPDAAARPTSWYRLRPASMSRDGTRMIIAVRTVLERVRGELARLTADEAADEAADLETLAGGPGWFERAVLRHALEHATVDAVGPRPDRVARALATLAVGREAAGCRGTGPRPGLGGGAAEPGAEGRARDGAALAEQAYWSAAYAACRSPRALWADPPATTAERLRALWLAMEEGGEAAAGAADAAPAWLAERAALDAADRERAVSALVSRVISMAASARPSGVGAQVQVQVQGLGRNGRLVASALLRAGVALRAQDDALGEPGVHATLASLGAVRREDGWWVSARAAAGAAAVVGAAVGEAGVVDVLTPDDDEAWAARLIAERPAPRVLRLSEVRRGLGAAARARVSAAFASAGVAA